MNRVTRRVAFLTLSFLASPAPLPACPLDIPPDLTVAAPGWLGMAVSGAGDVNGDGRRDVLVGAPSFFTASHVYLFTSGADGLEPAPTWVYSAGRGTDLGSALVGLGDVEGDGFDDVAVAEPRYQGPGRAEGRVLVFSGTPDGLPPEPDVEIRADDIDRNFGLEMTAGDFDGDGHPDLALTVSRDEAPIRVHRGTPSGIDSVPIVLVGPPDEHFGSGIAAADFNGDGFDDLAVGASRCSVGAPLGGCVFVFAGSPLGLSRTASLVTWGSTVEEFRGTRLDAVGDVDGDGFEDLVIGGDRRGPDLERLPIDLHLGGPDGLSPSAFWTPGDLGPFIDASPKAAGPFDLDCDGLREIAIGNRNDRAEAMPLEQQGSVRIFELGPLGLEEVLECRQHGGVVAQRLGESVARVGDLDGNGLEDLIIGAIGWDPMPPPGLLRVVLANCPPSVVLPASHFGACDGVNLSSETADPEADDLAYTWTSACPGLAFAPDTGAPDPSVSIMGECDVACDVRLTVADEHGAATGAATTVVLVDSAPPALAGVPADVTVSCDAIPAPAVVTASDACDPLPASSFVETRFDGPCPGTHELHRTWTATDACGNATSSGQIVAVEDREPPAIGLHEPGEVELWPPSHRPACFTVEDWAPDATDACSMPVAWRFVGCTSTDADDATGDGASTQDCSIVDAGLRACVRAERTGRSSRGRTYALSAVTRDACGNESEPVVLLRVSVPHDRSR